MIIDFHTHIGQFGRSAEHVIKHHRYYGGGKSVVLPIEPGDSMATEVLDDSWATEHALAAYDTYGDEIIPFCHVNPLALDALDQIRRYHATGKVRGFGEHKVRLAVDHPISMDIYRLCGEYGWPVLLHLQYRDYNYNFEDFEAVLKACPETIFIGHATSWWANVSADAPSDYRAPDYESYPTGPVVRVGLTDRLLEEYPNIYGDISAGSGFGALSRDREFGRDFVRRHRSKLLWATDCPCRDGEGNWGEGRKRECFAAQSLPLLRDYCESEDHFADITYRNAERLLGL